MSTTLRIHPAIGVSRSGNATDYVISPETSAGMPVAGSAVSGGLPTKPGTEGDPITDQDLRQDGKLKPQAQRFRIYAYATTPDGTYPYKGAVDEVVIGSVVDGKTVQSITWQCHMANKKANNWIIPEEPATTGVDNNVGGLAHYGNGQTPFVRNGYFGIDHDPLTEKPGTGVDPSLVDMSDPKRLKYLVLDSGPKLINSATSAGQRVMFDAATPCQYLDSSGAPTAVDYPVQFPSLNFSQMYEPSGAGLDNMGGMETDDKGRLLVIGSPGYAAGWMQSENNPGGTLPDGTPDAPFDLGSDIDNDGWLDDAGDGPITAALHFTDGTTRMIDVPAWCICADPAYAPQVRNVVNIWDEVYNSWVRNPDLALVPELFSGGSYDTSYQPNFGEDIWPMFRAAHLQMFTTDLNDKGLGAHQRIQQITAQDDPTKYLSVKDFIRNPNTGADNDLQTGAPLMPLALGDTGASFLTVTNTQYFFLEQWYAKAYSETDASTDLSAGEQIDKNTLTNLLGGRFSPGIDLTFIVRDQYLYRQDWKDADVGPFRVAQAPMDYASANKDTPFLSVGYTPNRGTPNTVEPGDLCKFMALPWHTDYNSCATHTPAPNPARNNTLFWSWPAQRPVSVYTYEDYKNNDNAFYGNQRFSVRGTGTSVFPGDHNDGSSLPENVGRYQERVDMIKNWMNIGVVVQGAAIEGLQGDGQDLFLEVESLLSGPSDVSQPWPIQTTDKVYPEDDS